MREFNTVPTFKQLVSYNPDLKACFFDMDGTIFNAEPLHAKAMAAIFIKSKKLPLTEKELEEQCIGKTDSQVFQEFKDIFGIEFCEKSVMTEKENIMKDNLLQMNPADCNFFNTNFIELFEELRRNKIKILLVTSSEKKTTHNLLEYFNLTSFFDYIITREDTMLNKPHPMPYIHALELSKTNQKEVIIFEDSEVGIKSGSQVTDYIAKACWY